MSVPSIEFIKTDDFNDKDECNIELEFVKQMQKTGVGLLGVPENRSKCGEVFMSDQKTFILICSICKELYTSMLDFGEHYMEQHLKEEKILHECRLVHTVEVNNEKKRPLLSVELLDEDEDEVTNAIVEPLPEIEVQIIEVENDGDDYNESDDSDYSEDDSDVGSASDCEPLKRKYKKTANKSDPRLFCELCERQYKSAMAFSRHVSKMHDQNKKNPYSLKCRYCDREFPTENELNEHKNTHDRLRPFQCPQCPKSFKSRNHRQAHINIHTGDRPYKCSKCSSAFKTEYNLRRHMSTHRGKPENHCRYCDREFPTENELNEHKNTHDRLRPFQCPQCPKSFKSRNHRQAHINIHTGDRPYKCSKCSSAFGTEYNLRRHMLTHSMKSKDDIDLPDNLRRHTLTNSMKSKDDIDLPDREIPQNHCTDDRKTDGRLFCNICLKQYFILNDFYEHYIKDHGGEFICQYCAMGFSDQESLEAHRKNHDLLSPYTCLHCNKTFTTKHVRQHHIKVIHMGQKPFKCTLCYCSFETGSKLRVHKLTHSFPGIYHCEICGRQFIHESRKKAHMRRHTGEKPFQCELCGKSFILRSLLTDHVKRHNNTKNFECSLCDKRFYTNVQLKYHLVVHTNEKPFDCPDCGKSFSRSKTLRTHRKIHSDVKQYSCNICGKEFSQAAGLYAHKKSHGTTIVTESSPLFLL